MSTNNNNVGPIQIFIVNRVFDILFDPFFLNLVHIMAFQIGLGFIEIIIGRFFIWFGYKKADFKYIYRSQLSEP